jgi:tetratricopeptide (TPR) repeat protein
LTLWPRPENYGKVLRDCAKCLGLNDKNVKALYRSAKALYALERLTEALDCCDHALAVDPENKAVIQERERCKKRIDLLDEKKRKEEEKKRLELEKKEKIDKMVKVLLDVHSNMPIGLTHPLQLS